MSTLPFSENVIKIFKGYEDSAVCQPTLWGEPKSQEPKVRDLHRKEVFEEPMLSTPAYYGTTSDTEPL